MCPQTYFRHLLQLCWLKKRYFFFLHTLPNCWYLSRSLMKMSILCFFFHQWEYQMSSTRSNLSNVHIKSQWKKYPCPCKEEMESLPLDLLAQAVQMLLAVLVHPASKRNMAGKHKSFIYRGEESSNQSVHAVRNIDSPEYPYTEIWKFTVCFHHKNERRKKQNENWSSSSSALKTLPSSKKWVL